MRNWILIGGLFVIISYLLCAVVLAFARVSGVDQWGDLFSLGQLVLDALVLPVAVVGFVVTINELRKAQAIPRLALYWESEPGVVDRELSLPLPRHPGPASSVGGRLVAMNEGNTVAVWYSIHFDVPLHIFQAADLRVDDMPRQWVIHAGEQSDWRIDVLPQIMRVAFCSNGHVASFPGYPLPLGILNFPSAKSVQHRREYTVRYTVVTDRGGPSHGSLVIQLGSRAG